MTEADISRKIQGILKEELIGCVIFKHNDRSNGGIPDMSLTYDGQTYWIEVKYIRPDWTASRIRKAMPPAQLHIARCLEHRGRCVYMIAYEHNKSLSLSVIAPNEVDRFLRRENVALHIGNIIGLEGYHGRLDDVVRLWAKVYR